MHRRPYSSACIALSAGLLGSASALAQEGQPASPADANSDGTTSVEEFRAYLIERVPTLNGQMVDRIAERVDTDADGVISADEFAGRMDAFRAVTSGADGAEQEAKTQETDPLEGEPVVIPALSSSPDATLLLITGDEIAPAWVPFAAWKTQQGKATKIITVRSINEQYEADSIQEKIRLCVRDHIDNHSTRWVLLGGDCTPTGGLVPGGHTTVHAQERAGIPTDIVYISPTNWDADGDGVFGEWDDDQGAITYPDGSVGLGRVPVRTAEDVRAFTDKVIAYESAYPADAFAEQMVYTCTDTPAYPKVRASWDRYVSNEWDGSVSRFFNTETPWDEEGKPGSHDLSDANLVGLINGRETGKLHIHGHGLIDLWALEGSTFDAKDVGRLDNDGAYPLITTVSCFTGQYDSAQDPCIVESMIREPSAGSVAIVAPVRTGKPHFHSPSDFRLMVSEGKLDGTTMTMTRYWSLGLGEHLTTGQALMKTKGSLAEDARQTDNYHLCICELNLLGDPTLDMRATAPNTPTMTAALNDEDGETRLVVRSDAPNATVCAWMGLDMYEVVRTDDNGHASIPVSGGARGNIVVTLSGPSLNTTSRSVRVE